MQTQALMSANITCQHTVDDSENYPAKTRDGN